MKPEEYFKLQQIEFQNANIESWVSRNKHFLYSPIERILRHDLFLKKNKDNHSQKQQMVQPGALACTSAYAKLIKKGHRKVFYLKVRKIDSVFLFEVFLLNNQNCFYTNLSCQGMYLHALH